MFCIGWALQTVLGLKLMVLVEGCGYYGMTLFKLRNTKFYHAFASSRRRVNKVTGLRKDNRKWCTNLEHLCALTSGFYNSIFTSNGVDSSSYPICGYFPRVEARQITYLLAPVMDEEALQIARIKHEDNAFLDAFDAEVDGVKDFESRNEVGASTFQTSDAAVTAMKKYVSSKKMSRSEDGLSALVKEISKFGAAYQETMQEIKSIVALLQKRGRGK
ncbi:hypothetical protein V6N11_013804 [Hibiscus sabdariffa]|uniref:Uncharacterized protein n=1 Tax=Hibiscus sabdariffa TaxID=183260 RepID=A0ABR2PDR8_9ROSI